MCKIDLSENRIRSGVLLKHLAKPISADFLTIDARINGHDEGGEIVHGTDDDNSSDLDVEELLTEYSGTIRRSARAMLVEAANRERKSIDRFETRLRRYWGRAIDRLRTLHVLNREFGAELSAHKRPHAIKRNRVLDVVLIRLHARSCRIASEVICLLAGGCADGAHARWRALHELSVVMLFLSKHGERAARLFVANEQTARTANMAEYESHAGKLGFDPHSELEIEYGNAIRDEHIERHGNRITKPYGWAAIILDRKRVTFRDLECEVGLEHWRPLYTMASLNNHADAPSLEFDLGDNQRGRAILLAGPSNLGLADPGHQTAISLTRIMTVMLRLHQSAQATFIVKVAIDLSHEIGEEFSRVHRELDAVSSAQTPSDATALSLDTEEL
ncbi:MAG: DUF5677 domain-containing protein [Planctomycetota bacterium]